MFLLSTGAKETRTQTTKMNSETGGQENQYTTALNLKRNFASVTGFSNAS